MARLLDVVIDCGHPAALARFWAAALDDYNVAPYDADELARLRSLGIDDPEDDPTVLVEPTGPGPRVWLQAVPESKRAKNRVHLDLRCEDLDREIDRLVALGATVSAIVEADRHVVMRDPEDNEFCLFG
jgi:Glyoxalase-like domain